MKRMMAAPRLPPLPELIGELPVFRVHGPELPGSVAPGEVDDASDAALVVANHGVGDLLERVGHEVVAGDPAGREFRGPFAVTQIDRGEEDIMRGLGAANCPTWACS